MALPTFDGVLSSRFWMWKCLAVLLLCVVVFTCSPALLVERQVQLPPAYELKAQHPFADTATLPGAEDDGERSHGAKLTPRVFGSIMLALATRFSLHPYLPSSLGGILYLLSGLLVGYRVTNDRLIGFLLGVTFAGLYSCSACFAISWTPKPFDGIVLGLIGLTMVFLDNPWLMSVTAFLSCWTDERAVLSMIFIGALLLLRPAGDVKEKRSGCVSLIAAVVAYLVTRVILASVLQWNPPDFSMLGMSMPHAFVFAQLALWTSFKGGVIAIAFAGWLLFQRQLYGELGLLTAMVGLAVLSCLLVFDVSRAGSFAFPLLPVAFAILARHEAPAGEQRTVATCCAVVSLLAPNHEIIAGAAIKWLQPLSAYFLN